MPSESAERASVKVTVALARCRSFGAAAKMTCCEAVDPSLDTTVDVSTCVPAMAIAQVESGRANHCLAPGPGPNLTLSCTPGGELAAEGDKATADICTVPSNASMPAVQ